MQAGSAIAKYKKSLFVSYSCLPMMLMSLVIIYSIRVLSHLNDATALPL